MPSSCPNCGADWTRTELMGEASHGGGYRVHCHGCGHEWDDVNASHHERETLRRRAVPVTTESIAAEGRREQAEHDAALRALEAEHATE